jgi:hypothetical protein
LINKRNLEININQISWLKLIKLFKNFVMSNNGSAITAAVVGHNFEDFYTADQKHFLVTRPLLGKVVDVVLTPAMKRFAVRDKFSKINASFNEEFIELFWNEIWVDINCKEIYGRRVLRSISLTELRKMKENLTTSVEAYAFIIKRVLPMLKPAVFFLRGPNTKIYTLQVTRKLFRGWKVEINDSGSIKRGSLVFSNKP